MSINGKLAEELGEILLRKKQTVTTVESCTGGGIAYAITNVAGSSQWFRQAWVTYANEAKETLVGVSKETLMEHGAVSAQTVVEMSYGGLRAADADYCIAVSGIAGPGGGTDAKPVGTVWFAIRHKDTCLTYHQVFTGDRAAIRQQAIHFALKKLIQIAVVD
ncbi:CinA family protein [Agaribacter flavus]|uniref:CinA family protein n=1 Tax=Agaribacter flavus TaxID=1902781 RepID=A0ABV7FTZ6_9ALTE